jgi:predicted DNA-binding transcriptional regulator AlpA
MQAMALPETGFVRSYQLIGCPRRGIVGVLPFGRSTLWERVAKGPFPKPIKLSARTTVWRVEDIRAFIEAQGK